jgi:hypothetical protein
MADLLDVSLPSFAKYASHNGYDLVVPAAKHFANMARPYSWGKVPLISALMRNGYDAVLWLDADVVIRKHDRDIIDDLPADAPMGMVVHHTPDGAVPNCGVWLVRAAASELIDGLWHRDGFKRSSCWWEQAAAIAALGGDPDASSVLVPPGPMWSELPYEWNPHVKDGRGIPGDCRFFHATMFPDRKEAMLHYARFE